jgi:hypothetical protein
VPRTIPKDRFQELIEAATVVLLEQGHRKGAAVKRHGLRMRHFAPLAGFVMPTVVIGYGVAIPRSCIAGWSELTVDFGATMVGACITYWTGLRSRPATA